MASREHVRKYDSSTAGRSVLTNRRIQDSRWKGEEAPVVDAPAPAPRRQKVTKKVTSTIRKG